MPEVSFVFLNAPSFLSFRDVDPPASVFSSLLNEGIRWQARSASQEKRPFFPPGLGPITLRPLGLHPKSLRDGAIHRYAP